MQTVVGESLLSDSPTCLDPAFFPFYTWKDHENGGSGFLGLASTLKEKVASSLFTSLDSSLYFWPNNSLLFCYLFEAFEKIILNIFYPVFFVVFRYRTDVNNLNHFYQKGNLGNKLLMCSIFFPKYCGFSKH